MPLLRHALLLLSLSIAGALADFAGLTYPAPVDLASKRSLVSAAWENLTATLDAYLNKPQNTTANSSLAIVKNLTFSTGLFSLHDPAAQQLQYHYTAPEIANAPNGTNKVDGDSIYVTASVSKLFTALAGLISLTEEEWNRPLTQIFPALADIAGRGEQNPIYNIQWDKITPWTLAAQSAGVPRLTLGDFIFREPSVAATLGLPPMDVSSWGPCWATPGFCSAEDYVKNLGSYPPNFLPWTNPAYANDGFILLGVAISNITGKPMEDLYRESILQPLGMTSSGSRAPTGEAELARSAIAFGFGLDAALLAPSGGMYSTTNDLAKFGLAILNSTLLPADKTRKWMKPISHTASLTYSVGAPWEIARYVHPSTGKVTDLYTKIGDSGSYGAIVVLIPDYGVGFSLLAEYTDQAIRVPAVSIVLDHITNAILPALEAQAAAEAECNFAGSYVSTDATLNSSVTIALNESTVPGTSWGGLSITRWVSNGTDVLASANFGGIKPRLLPSIPNQSPEGTPGQVAFQLSQYPETNSYFAPGASELEVQGPFTGQYNTNNDWLSAGSSPYGKLAINLFVFDVDGQGRATALSPAATRATLRREG